MQSPKGAQVAPDPRRYEPTFICKWDRRKSTPGDARGGLCTGIRRDRHWNAPNDARRASQADIFRNVPLCLWWIFFLGDDRSRRRYFSVKEAKNATTPWLFRGGVGTVSSKRADGTEARPMCLRRWSKPASELRAAPFTTLFALHRFIIPGTRRSRTPNVFARTTRRGPFRDALIARSQRVT